MRVESQSIVLNSNKSEFRNSFYPPLQLDPKGKHEIALLNLDMYHSVPNIDESNNKFIYYCDDEKFIIEIPTGSYEIKEIDNFIQKILIKNSHDDFFDIKANITTLKCILNIKNGCIKINFNEENSLKSLLGFSDDTVLEGVGEYEGQNIVNILSVNSIFVNCDIIEGSYLNDSQKPILYSFFPNVSPGYKIVEKPQSVVYLPITLPVLNSIHIWLTDQNHKLLNLKGETITLRLHLKSTF